MLFRSILAARRSVPSGRRAGFRPRLESLEDRTVPSTLMVSNLADNGEGSLRQAVVAANVQPGADTILFADELSGTISLTTGQLNITDDLTIDGPGAGQLAVSGGLQSRVFRISGGVTTSIVGLTITGGRVTGAAAEGGGIQNSGALTLDRVILTDNQVAITGSAQARGGAVANLSGGTLTVIDSLFTNNRALGGPAGGIGNGGGIFNLTGTLTVTGSTFAGNQAVGGSGGGQALGGGITSTMGSTATISDCTFIGNQAVAGNGGTGVGFGRGGGLVNNGSFMMVENCQILDNVARGGSGSTRPGPRVGFASGGGIISGDAAATLVLTGSTVRGNLALGGDGNTCTGGTAFVGAALGGGLTNVATATLTDCLFEGNEARGGSGNRGDGVGHQLVGTGFGGGIATTAGDPTGNPSRLTLRDVTVRHNRAIGGDGNAAGTLTFVGAGIGGGVASDGSNNNIPLSSVSTTIILDCTVAHNQAVGGRGGAALGGGVANQLGAVTSVAGGALSHNHARGGDGGAGMGGGIFNGPASNHPSNPGAETILIVEQSPITHNKAQGGTTPAGGSAGDGLGGGLWNGGTASIFDTALSYNHALGNDDSGGGNGFGGGAYNQAAATLALVRCTVTANHANGGDDGGEGIGGGVYNLGSFDFDEFTLISGNHASTSDDDIFDL